MMIFGMSLKLFVYFEGKEIHEVYNFYTHHIKTKKLQLRARRMNAQ